MCTAGLDPAISGVCCAAGEAGLGNCQGTTRILGMEVTAAGCCQGAPPELDYFGGCASGNSSRKLPWNPTKSYLALG